ncbi:MAG TPA: endolytic transglycosylase MltG [Bryobacteraceae bacterium]|nr:endolytic transglycosylase MltG [Bryobacteraceae bacterium]
MRYLIIPLLLVVLAGAWVMYRLNQPYQGFGGPVFVEFAHGTSTRSIASVLADKGVIRDRWLFLAARGVRRGATLQAGEYKFDKPASPLQIVRRLIKGDIYYMELLVPEGFNMFDIADALGKLGTMKAETFLAAARDPSLIRDIDAKAPSLEGYLFPNKYRIYRHTTAQQICRMMTGEFRAQWKALGRGADAHAAVTLASMVEREARRPEERPLVASVFTNRLRIGMKLDCDPTTVYAALLDGRYRGTIYRSDLANMSLWNTYQHVGLPPGPIANPGLGSIRAALAPAETHYLYFVAKADGSGGHNFSDSLARHEAAVAGYRDAVRR